MTASKQPAAPAYRFDDVLVDCENFRIQKADEVRTLTPRAFDVLVCLLNNSGRVVEKQELFEQVWKESFVTDNALTRAVKEIRRAIGDEADAPRYIETVPKRGYRFIAEVTRAETVTATEAAARPSVAPRPVAAPLAAPGQSASPEPTPAAIQKDAKEPFYRVNKQALLLAALALALIVVALLALRMIRAGQPATQTAGAQRTTQVTNWASLDAFPSLSPDGNSIAYASDHDGSFEIYVKPLATGSREIQITSDGEQNFQPAWSSDGQRIAFYSKNRGGIWVVGATGGKIKQLTEFGSRPSWSPDGTMIAFQSDAITELGANASPSMPPSTIWVVNSQGGAPRYITQAGNPAGGHGEPSWSPDGQRIAFCVSDYSMRSIWTVSSKGGDLKQVVAFMAYDPVYAPDGESIYYGFNSGFYKIGVSSAGEATGEPVEIISPSPARLRHFTISADGKKIAYTSLLITSNIWSIPISPSSSEAAGPPVPLTQDRSFRNLFAAFSPDGKRIAFHSWKTGSFSNIWLADADGKNETQITTDGGAYPVWFPDGERIAFFARRQDKPTMWVTNLKTEQEKALFDFDEEVQYMRMSPDGRQVAFNTNKSGAINTAVMPIEGGQAKQLTFDNEMMGFACWSPDSKTLALQVKRGDDTHIAIVPSDGGEVTQLTFDKGQSWIYSFSPDGDKIIFAGQRNNYWNLFWVSRSTRQQKQLTNYTKLNAYVRYPAWSPLGNQIAYEYAETTGNIWVMELK